MRWFSNHESAARGEVSILAIIETLLATSISIGIAFYYDTTLYILISACIAPFLLLRTDDSTELGLKWFGWWFDKLESVLAYFDAKIDTSGNLAESLFYPILVLVYFLLIFFPLVALASVIIKFAATLLSFLCNPIASISFIPRNWLRVTLSTDLATPPELITGLDTSDFAKKHGISFAELVFDIKNQVLKKDFFLVVLLSAFVAVWFAPAILYRLSLKATSIIYLPFIWLVKPPKTDVDEQTQLELIKDSQLEKIKRFYAWFVVLVLTALPIALYLWGMQLPWAELQTSVLAEYFAPLQGIDSIDSWHITRFLAALLTLVMCYAIADVMLIKLRRYADLPLGAAVFWLGVLGKLRLVFTLWTIGCGLYLLSLQVDWENLPKIDWLPSTIEEKALVR